MISNYLTILEESLDKKKEVLQQIQKLSQNQAELLKCEDLDLQAFDKCVEQKDVCIKELTELDNGFESLYEKVSKELSSNKEQYAVQIRRMQDRIREISGLNMVIQALESRNRDMVTNYFGKQRTKLGKDRKSSKVAYGYYKNFKNAALEDSRAFDLKK